MKTVNGLFDNYNDASAAVSALEARGVPSDDISIVSNNADNRHKHEDNDNGAAEGAGTGAGIGAVVGGASRHVDARAVLQQQPRQLREAVVHRAVQHGLPAVDDLEQRRARPHGGGAVLEVDGAQRHARADVAVEPEKTDTAAVPPSRRQFQILDGLHSNRFG